MSWYAIDVSNQTLLYSDEQHAMSESKRGLKDKLSKYNDVTSHPWLNDRRKLLKIIQELHKFSRLMRTRHFVEKTLEVTWIRVLALYTSYTTHWKLTIVHRGLSFESCGRFVNRNSEFLDELKTKIPCFIPWKVYWRWRSNSLWMLLSLATLQESVRLFWNVAVNNKWWRYHKYRAV